VGRRLTYVFAGGGTGGHLFPGIAVAEELIARDAQARVLFVGSERGVERKIVQRHNYEHRALPVEPSTTLRRNPVRFLYRNWRARRQAAAFLDRLKPVAVIGLGGFASVPVVLAAYSRQISTLLLEQNIVPGRATRWLSGWASLVCLSFDELQGRLSPRTSTCVTGNPIRKPMSELHTRSSSPKQNSPPVLLVLGGSQGATGVNGMALKAVEYLRPNLAGWTIIHQTGAAQHADVARRYDELELRAETAPFFTDLTDRYQRATLAVTRGGATSLAELACAGVPSIVVPYPNSLGNHQLLNARFYHSHGAARIVEQNDGVAAAARVLQHELAELLANADLRYSMRIAMHGLGKPNAASHVVDCLQDLIGVDCASLRRSA
jgi:UDP-N-acetylglucosamine--N-acetylmuramyl-(pentapeptide) pyrophosphoryl-undecaprenol N-acetylglucosamine transferase